MRISHSSYSKYIEKLSKEITGESLFSPLLYNYRTFVFPFLDKKGEVLIIDLNPKTPLLFKTKKDLFFTSLLSKFNQRLQKYIGRSLIVSISLKEDDLIVELKLESNETGKTFILLVQLIPNNPNLFLLEEDKTLIDYCFSSSKEHYEKNTQFKVPQNNNFIDGEIEINDDLIAKLVLDENENRNKDKYGELISYLQAKIKGANKRINAIKNDIEIASKNLIFKEIADYILSTESNLKLHKNEIDFEGKIIELDSSKTLLENVNYFYKKAKKAKETIARSEINIQNAMEQIKSYHAVLAQYESETEKQRDELLALYLPSKTKKEIKPTFINRPWKINFNGTIIYFGKNASQNDFLSFTMKLDREFTWLHIKDRTGAHLVIANKKPTENELLTACEIALLCSKAKAGEISYTKKKNVRRGHVTGEALIKNYSTIRVNSIRKETIELLEKAVRCD